MPVASVNGVALNYEILGTRGPAVAVTPGGRNSLDNIRSLGGRIADAGYRVLIHDRRNCGASEVAFDGSRSEFEIWADDLHELLRQHGMLPAIIGGRSSGARLSLAFAIGYPQAVRALILWRVTGGAFAVERLAQEYYENYAALAERGGMAAVCADPHFAEVIRNRPANRDKLMAFDAEEFIAIMRRWRELFEAGAEQPLIGAREQDLRAIAVPTCIIPGDDRSHPGETAARAARLIPDCEVHKVMAGDKAVDVTPIEDWHAKEAEIVAVFVDFLARALKPQPVPSR
jgi:pimeloyl-ACP methyl ester carboxylesterase